MTTKSTDEVQEILLEMRAACEEAAHRHGATDGQIPGLLEEQDQRLQGLIEEMGARGLRPAAFRPRALTVTGQLLIERFGRPDEEDIRLAIQDQRGTVINGLRSKGMLLGWVRDDPVEHPVVGDVMGEIAVHVMKSLPAFMVKSEVSLKAWAGGIAKNCLADTVRVQARRGEVERPLEDCLVQELMSAANRGASQDDSMLRLVARAREQIISREGGVQEWERIVHMAEMPRRGRAARVRLREVLADIEGVPVEAFGTETEEPDRVGTQAGPAVVRPAAAPDGGFIARCSVCGAIGDEATSIQVAMDDVRAHRRIHSSEGVE